MRSPSTLAGLLLLGLGACAVPPHSYFGPRISAVRLQDSSHEAGVESSASLGYGAGLSGGLIYPGGFRLDLGVDYRNSNFGDFNVAGTTVGGIGDVKSTAVMLTGLFELKNSSGVHPYIGAGLGWALVSYQVSAFGDPAYLNDSDSVLAYQLLLGVLCPLDEELELALGYRYFATAEAKLTDNSGGHFPAEYDSHSLELGLQLRF